MSGFYVNHLKSVTAQRIAPIIEDKFASPVSMTGDSQSVLTFDVPFGGNSNDYLSAAYAVIRDHPEFFYYEMNIQSSIIGNHITLRLPLLYTPEEIRTYKIRLKDAIKKIVSKTDLYRSMWDKERYIFEYLQTHTDYNDKNSMHENYNIIGPLLLGKGVCEGISKAFAVLCHQVGIPCIVVFDDNHMWNMVNIGGTLAHVDATWGTKNGSVCDYSYFNITDREINIDHGKEINCVPTCTNDTLGYYYRQGTLFNTPKELKEYLMKHLMADRGKQLHIKLKCGNIEQIVDEVAAMIPFGFRYAYNPKLNTATINI